jgi:NitT/TauT family transport system substrate-binding protein
LNLTTTSRLIAASLAVALSLSISLPARAADRISIGQYGVNVESLPWAIALNKGILAKDGVDIDGFIGANGGGTSVRNMMAGSVPVAQMAPAAVVAAVQTGLDVKIIWAGANNLGDLSWVVRADSPYHKISDLKGQKLAFTQPQSTTEMVLRTILNKTKMSNDVTIQPLGGISAGIVALDSGAVAAAPIEEPLLLKNPENYRVLFRVTDYVPNMIFSVGVTTTDFAKSHPDYIRKLMQAHKDAVDYMYAHPADAVAVYQQVWNTNDATIAQIIPKLIKENYWSSNAINMSGLQAMLDAMLLVGAIDKRIDAKTLVDPEFLR